MALAQIECFSHLICMELMNQYADSESRGLSQMIDAYFLGFQAGKVKFDQEKIRKTLFFLQQSNNEAQMKKENITQKVQNLQFYMKQGKSIDEIMPFKLSDDSIDNLIKKANKIIKEKWQQLGVVLGAKDKQELPQQKIEQQLLLQNKPKVNNQQNGSQLLNEQLQDPRQIPLRKINIKEVNFEYKPNPQNNRISWQNQKRQGDCQPQLQFLEEPIQLQRFEQEKMNKQLLLRKNPELQIPILDKQQRPPLQMIPNLSQTEHSLILRLVEDHLQKRIEEQNSKITICNICLNELNLDQSYDLLACKHSFHLECLKLFGESQCELPIICPQVGCGKEIDIDDIGVLVDQKKRENLEQHQFNKFLMKNPQNYFSCPTPGCQSVYAIEGPIQICTNCQQVFCVKCKSLFHDGDCGEEKFFKMAKKENLSQCLKCFHWVEKSYGCNHIICVCGHEFCYHCQKEWVKGEECKCIEEEEEGQRFNPINFQMFQEQLRNAGNKIPIQQVQQQVQDEEN